tara:strand:+ start:162 stop:632 length:471 start_codon:yes stop_codon:yes gene_type:complete
MKKELKSFGVKCPEDWATNQKWRGIIRYFRRGIIGDVIGGYYGVDSTDGKFDLWSMDSYSEILTIDQAHDYLFGIEFVKGDLVKNKYSDNYIFECILSEDLDDENCVIKHNNAFFLYHTSKLTKVKPTPDIIEEKAKELHDYLAVEIEKLKQLIKK